MSVYSILVFFLLFAAVITKGRNGGRKWFVFLAFLLLFVVMGLRDVRTIGNDSATSYRYAFSAMKNMSWGELNGKGEHNYNILFSYLMKLGYLATKGDYQLFIAVLSAFLMFSYMHFINRYSPSPLISVLCLLGLLYYTLLFDALKQAMAMAILLYAFDAIIEKKPVRFLLLVGLAAGFHFPALVFLPAYWIGRMKVGRWYLILLAVVLLLTYVFRDTMLRLMMDAYGGESADATMAGVRFLRNKVIIMIAIVVFSLAIRPPTTGDTVYNALLMFVGVSIVFQTFCGYNNIFERLADYYFQTVIVFVPMVFDRSAPDSRLFSGAVVRLMREVIPVLIGAFAIWRFLNVVLGSAYYSPFRFFWQ